MIHKKTVNKSQDPRPKIQASRDGSLGIWDLKFGALDLGFRAWNIFHTRIYLRNMSNN